MAKAKTTEVTQVATAGGITTLDADAISALLAKSKQRGEYDRQLKNFVDEGVPGVQVSLAEGVFQGKAASSVKAGFEGAKKREGAPAEAANVRVIQDGDSIYLIRTDLA